MASNMELTFPTDKSKFDTDDRISFSKLDNKYIAIHDDGEEYEFDEEHQIWVIYEEFEDHNDFQNDVNADAQSTQSEPRKRKEAPTACDYEQDSSSKASAKPQRPQKKAKAPPAPRQNTAVYVTGIPSDATFEEIHDLFSRKGGVIAEEIDSGRPRIKMYMNADGKFKGDALIVFFKPQSVEMAIMLLDDTDFRYTNSGKPEGRMRVQEADSSYKKTKYEEGDSSGQGEQKAAEPRAKKSEHDRQKIIKRTQKMQSKLADWDDDYEQDRPKVKEKYEKTVVLSHMFTLQELEEDPTALLDIKEDVREECSKLGTVTNVVLYDLEEEGIVSIKFKEKEAALECVQKMHGRNFGGQVVEAYLATGKERFRQSKNESYESDSE